MRYVFVPDPRDFALYSRETEDGRSNKKEKYMGNWREMYKSSENKCCTTPLKYAEQGKGESILARIFEKTAEVLAATSSPFLRAGLWFVEGLISTDEAGR